MISEQHNYELWQIHAYQALPLTYQSLALEITNRCPAKCGICYQKTETPISICGVALDEGVAKEAISDAASSPYVSSRFHIAGGEAFLELDKCVRLFEHARRAGFSEITATTNAFWARSPLRAHSIAKALKRAGVTGLEVSTDFWHQAYVHPIAIDNCVRACDAADIRVILRVLSTQSHPIGRALSALRPETLRHCSMIVCGNVFRVGNAKASIDVDEVRRRSLHFPCFSAFNLAINAYGDVVPCCAGLDQSNLSFGNIHKSHLRTVIDAMNKSQVARVLAFFGASFFLPVVERLGAYSKDLEALATPCELCALMFSRDDVISAIGKYLRDLQKKAIYAAIAYLKSQQAS